MAPFKSWPHRWLLTIWLLCVVAQSLHFHGYFDQPLGRSIRWAAVDWLVWMTLMTLVVQAGRPRTRIQWLALAGAAPLVGGAQIVVSTAIHALFEAPARPFLADVLHLLDKRWLQNLLIFAVLHVALDRLFKRAIPARQARRIRIIDGPHTHWLDAEHIRFVEAAGNYICVHTPDQRIVTREPLKRFHRRLGDERFLRVSRSCLVNRHCVERCERVDRNRVELQLTGGATAAVGRTYWPKVREVLMT